MEIIDWIQDFYKKQCNGDWEHEHVIKIDTIDNPGWRVRIDLNDTNLYIEDVGWTLVDNGENDWYGYKITNGMFEASGDPSKLGLILRLFKGFIDG